MDRDAIKRATARLAGTARADASRLQKGLYDVDGRVDGLETNYGPSWKWLKDNFPLDGYIKDLVEGWATIRTGAFRAIYTALDTLSSELKTLVDTKHAEGKKYTDNRHSVAIEHANEGDEVLSDSIAEVEERLGEGLRGVRRTVADLAAELPEHKRAIYAEVGRKLDAALTDLEAYKGQIGRQLTEGLAAVRRELAEVDGKAEFLGEQLQSIDVKYTKYVSGRPRQGLEGAETEEALIPTVFEGGEAGTSENGLVAAFEQAAGTRVVESGEPVAVEGLYARPAVVPAQAERQTEPPQERGGIINLPPQGEAPPADQDQSHVDAAPSVEPPAQDSLPPAADQGSSAATPEGTQPDTNNPNAPSGS